VKRRSRQDIGSEPGEGANGKPNRALRQKKGRKRANCVDGEKEGHPTKRSRRRATGEAPGGIEKNSSVGREVLRLFGQKIVGKIKRSVGCVGTTEQKRKGRIREHLEIFFHIKRKRELNKLIIMGKENGAKKRGREKEGPFATGRTRSRQHKTFTGHNSDETILSKPRVNSTKSKEKGDGAPKRTKKIPYERVESN